MGLFTQVALAAVTVALTGCMADKASEQADAAGSGSLAEAGADAAAGSDAGSEDASDADAGRSDASPADAGPDGMSGPDASAKDGSSRDGGTASLVEVTAAYDTELMTHAEHICACFDEYEFESEEACLEGYVSLPVHGNACAEDALALDAAGSLMFFQCAAKAARRFTECLENDPSCGPTTLQKFGSCAMTYAARYEGCGVLPTAVEEALVPCDLAF